MRRKQKKKDNVMKILLKVIFFSVAVACGIYLFGTYNKTEVYKAKDDTVVNEDKLVAVESKYENSGVDVIYEATKTVVGISKLENIGTSIFGNVGENQLGLGTGLIVAADGYVLSNAHVTGEKFSNCYVTLENGSTYKGEVVWSNINLDLSITKIDVDGLEYATLGDSSNIKLGEEVYAIGNPIGYEFRRTVTFGIISGKDRTIKLEEDTVNSYMTDLIQTDATINPGNSGGPLIYKTGEVIGINTMKIDSADSIGFAVPINIVKPIIESYSSTGEFNEATIGIFAYDKDVIPYLEQNQSVKFDNGIYVAEIEEGGAASSIDLRIGDVITKIDGITLENMNDLREYIYMKKPGDMVEIDISRGVIKKTISLELGNR